MATGAFGSTASPQKMLGMLVQAQGRFRIGTAELFGSLETTSQTYSAYNAPIGIKDNKAMDVGVVSSLGINLAATVEPFDGVNERLPSIYVVTGETCELSAGIIQFDMQLLSVLLHHSVLYTLNSAPNKEYLLTFGTLCSIKARPIQIDATNIACFLPTGQNADLGITAFLMTLYNVISTSGLNWDNINAKQLNALATTWMGRPVDTLANGNQVGNIYAF